MMSKYLDMLEASLDTYDDPDERREMTRDELNAAMVELASDIFGAEAGQQLRDKLAGFDGWSNERLMTNIGVVKMYRDVLNPASAAWMMESLGFPIPGSVTITVAPQGSA